MTQCFKTRDASAINKSWFCNVTGHGDECIFSYDKQFQRATPYCDWIEALLMLFCCLCLYPCNAIAIYNYHRQRVTKEFMLLITALVATNCSYGICGLCQAIARVFESFPLGISGCMMMHIGGSILFTLSVYIFALISIERNISVRIKSRCHIRYPCLVAALVVIFLLTTAFYFYNYFIEESVVVISVDVPGLPNPVEICTVLGSKVQIQVSWINSLIYGLFGLVVPLIIAFGNYASLLFYVRNVSHNVVKKAKIRKRDLVLTAIMACSLLQFLILTAPLFVAVSEIAGDANARVTTSSGLYFAIALQIIDSALNPFWSSFVGARRRMKRSWKTGGADNMISNSSSEGTHEGLKLCELNTSLTANGESVLSVN